MDPCPTPHVKVSPSSGFLSASLQAPLAPVSPPSPWQADMDSCKCRPSPNTPSGHNEGEGIFDVRRFGAAGDGMTDDSQGLVGAFDAACAFSIEKGAKGTVLIPRTCFYTTALSFTGPCGPGVRFQIDGVILGPMDPSDYPPAEFTSPHFPYTNGLLTFRRMRGLVLEGQGAVEGQGFVFWERFRSKTLGLPIRPFAVRLMFCNDTTVRGLSLRNSPMYHLFAYDCKGLSITNMTTHSPGDSPNTDSIKMVGIEDCHIADCWFHGGDDDVSIVAVEDLVARNITVENVLATSGHGISIGSVGWDGTRACVSDVLVRNVTLARLTHGVRIKSWRGGRGIVRNVRYENVKLEDTTRAIALNQFYCDAHQNWTCGTSRRNVAFYNISYSNFSGHVNAVKRDSSIQMRCSASVPCTGIFLRDVNLIASSETRESKHVEAALTPSFENVLESAAENLQSFLPREGEGQPWAWAGADLVSPEQAEAIAEAASFCRFHNLEWTKDKQSGGGAVSSGRQ